MQLPGCVLHQALRRLALLADDEPGCESLGAAVHRRCRQRRLGCQLAMRHEVVERSQRRLDPLQPTREAGELVVVAIAVEAFEEVDGVADLLDLDPQLVTLHRSEIVQMFALLARLPDAPVENPLGIGGDGPIVIGAGSSGLDPLDHVNEQAAVAGRADRVASSFKRRSSLP